MTKTVITLLRGADTIGGSCIKISRGDDSIILDYGMPLMESGGGKLDDAVVDNPSIENGILLDVTDDNKKPPLAFVISHPHPDHYGLMDYVPQEIPIYVSEAAKCLIGIGNIFYDESMRVKCIAASPTYVPGKSFKVGPFKVTAYMMDHSAFGACSLLVEVDGKQIFYTGDFRGHGRKAKVNDYVMNEVRQPDMMLMEGTTLDDGHPATFPDEQSVEEAMLKVMKNTQGPVMVAGSGSNVDRIVSLYNAAKRANRILMLDLYQTYLLDELKKVSGGKAKGLPPHEGDDVRVFYPKNQCDALVKAVGAEVLYRYKDRQIKRDEIDFDGGHYVFRLSNFITKKLCAEFLKHERKPVLIYSMWQGYQAKQAAFKEISDLVGSDWQYIHTSGHAYLDHLKKFAAGINPKMLIPVHTLQGEAFASNFANVHVVKNNGSIVVE